VGAKPQRCFNIIQSESSAIRRGKEHNTEGMHKHQHVTINLFNDAFRGKYVRSQLKYF
jgi:hypothetical protein